MSRTSFDESFGLSKYGRIKRAGYCSSCQYVINHQPTRERIQRWAFEYIAQGEFIVRNSETTELLDDHKIIELSIVSSSGEVLFSSLIQTQKRHYACNIAEYIHSIACETLDATPRFTDV